MGLYFHHDLDWGPFQQASSALTKNPLIGWSLGTKRNTVTLTVNRLGDVPAPHFKFLAFLSTHCVLVSGGQRQGLAGLFRIPSWNDEQGVLAPGCLSDG